MLKYNTCNIPLAAALNTTFTFSWFRRLLNFPGNVIFYPLYYIFPYI